MRIAVFSDVHANQEALEAFLADAAGQGIDRYICLGDLVGYGASPNACIERIRGLNNLSCILGNHDEAVRRDGPCDMRNAAAQVVLWTRERISAENRRFLEGMLPTVDEARAIYSHATPFQPLQWHYVSRTESASRSLSFLKGRLGFVGHTHVPCIVTRKNFFSLQFLAPEEGMQVPVPPGRQMLVSCGSIGQPRDGDPRASYVIYDTGRNTIELRRVVYDTERTAGRIRAAGLPEMLALRLSRGV